MNQDQFLKEMQIIFCMEKIPYGTILKDTIDSLAIAEIIMHAEEHLGIQMSNEQVFNLKTYGDLLDTLKIS